MSLLTAPCDAALCKIIGRHLHSDLVSGKDADEIHPELARNVSQYNMTVLKLYLKLCVGESLLNYAFYLNYILL